MGRGNPPSKKQLSSQGMATSPPSEAPRHDNKTDDLLMLEAGLDRLKTHWPQVLWGLLLTGLTLNLTYLLWPEPSQTVVLSPHPETLKQPLESLPVLVASDTPSTYALVSPQDHQVVRTVSHHGGHAAFEKKKAFTGTLNFNTATAAQLQQLPGIGPAMADRILAYRKAHGGLKSCDDLNGVEGIGPKKLAKLKPHCAV